MTTSGTTLFNPALSDLVLESFARIQIKATSLTAEHTFQAHLSANLALAEWNVKTKTPNLWKIQLLSVPLQQGVGAYAVPGNVISILDYYVRTFTVGALTNLANAFSTTLNSGVVQVTLANHGQIIGNWVGFPIPVAVGGVLVFGFYTVQSIVDANNFTILISPAASPPLASSAITNGGVVPSFTTTANSNVVTVVLPNHALGVGQEFEVEVLTTVGGINVFGGYVVASVIDVNTFTIQTASPALSIATVSENQGLAQIATQSATVQTTDRVLLPISRTEFATIPNKFQQDPPTTVWFNRQISGIVNLWPVPDGNGPYTLFFYALVPIQDASMAGGLTIDVPTRFLEAFCAEMSARLAEKFAPGLYQERRARAEIAWETASSQDAEEVPLYVIPGLTGYFR